jgi:hypothetical protein
VNQVERVPQTVLRAILQDGMVGEEDGFELAALCVSFMPVADKSQ